MRFDRQLPVFGEEGQQRIMSSVVGIVGCGALGVNLITQLTMAGVSHFILCDGGSPQLNNLNSQFIYSANDYRSKAVISAEWILALNPSAEVQANSEPLTAENGDLFLGCDILVDCLDNKESKILLSELAGRMGIPLVHGDIKGTKGEIAISVPGKTISTSSISDDEDDAPSIGAAASVVSSMQALEVLRIISGIGTPNEGRIIRVDMDGWSTESE